MNNYFRKVTTRTRPTSADVLVLGAGAAGIAAARVLQDAGKHVLVVEARSRLGGRVHTDFSMAHHPVELGAEFIHGSKALTWKFMNEFGFRALPDANHGFCFMHDQMYHDNAAPVPCCEDLMSNLKNKVREYLASGKPNGSIRQFLDEQKGYPLHPSYGSTRRLLNNLIASEKGADIYSMSLAGLLEHDFSGYGDHNFRVVEGYGKLLERLASPLDIRLGVAIKQVLWDKRGVCLRGHGSNFRARQVVVTLPLGVLKSGDVQFVPALPVEKKQAIDRLGAAHVCKIIMQFREKFWPDYLAVLATTGDTQVWWPTGWNRTNPAPMLSALVGGQAARRFEAMGEAAIPEALRQLEGMFQRDLRPLFLGGRLISWNSKRYSRMGYSYLPIGSCPALRDRLAEPVGPLFFAGEATNRKQPSTVHGALESGIRAARQLLESKEVANGRLRQAVCISG